MPGIKLSKKLPSCPAPCDSAPPSPESSCSRSSYLRFLVSEIKYTFPYTFRTVRARVSRYLNPHALTLSPSIQTSCCTTNWNMYISRTNLCFVSILAWQWGSAFRGLCQSEPECCDYTETASQENWFFTQYIRYLYAREVFVSVSAYFEGCRLARNPTCNQLYVDMYRYERNGMDRAAARNTSNYGQPMRIQPNGLGQAVNQISFSFIPSGNFNGFYIGVRANGTCASIRRCQVYYRISPKRTVGLVTYPEIALPALGSTTPVTGVASCAPNSRNLTSLQVTCFADGNCEDSATCACNQGYKHLATCCIGERNSAMEVP